MSPSLPEARFNLGLTQESLGFRDEAIATWKQVAASGEPGWSEEASRRHADLSRARARAALTLDIAERLPKILEAADSAALNEVIKMDSEGVHRFVERQVLPGWAEATTEESAQRQLVVASTIAEAVARILGDRYLLDAVNRIIVASQLPDKAALTALREGHARFAIADSVAESGHIADALDNFRQAERAFIRANTPFQYRAAAAAAAFERDAAERLAGAAGYVRTRRYQYLWTRVQSTRALAYQREGRLLEALNLYSQPEEGAGAGQSDPALARARHISLLRDLAMNELAWREAFHSISLTLSTTSRFKDLLLTEIGTAALAVGHGEVALLYQNHAIEGLRQALLKASPDEEAVVRSLQMRLAFALERRANIALDLGDIEQVTRDAAESMRLGGNNLMFRARVSELQGRVLLRTDPTKAISAFSEALTNLPLSSDALYRVTLLMQRAEAYKKKGNVQAAKEDLL
ncbi:MAG TPA: hypothetical protein VGQ76_16660, partial [Thermoanaerobaculia bacterium]|nr:hypothetical protein [Thermoanaerobaculia bacterium]